MGRKKLGFDESRAIRLTAAQWKKIGVAGIAGVRAFIDAWEPVPLKTPVRNLRNFSGKTELCRNWNLNAAQAAKIDSVGLCVLRQAIDAWVPKPVTREGSWGKQDFINQFKR